MGLLGDPVALSPLLVQLGTAAFDQRGMFRVHGKVVVLFGIVLADISQMDCIRAVALLG